MAREQFKSRLGFILISAGCAVGLGNVWRFPYIVGEYGGAAFIILYLIFLAILGLPILVMEFSIGRASKRSIARAFDELEPPRSHWHVFKWLGITGLYLLMMFYTTVAGWMLAYIPKMATTNLASIGSEGETAAAGALSGLFESLLSNPSELIAWMVVACAIALLVCSLGLQKGVERITKVMMVCLLALILVLAIRACTLEGAVDGIAFYLLPDFSKIFSSWGTFGDAVFAALGQAFFTLSIGIGSMEIFGSYINKDYALTGEAVRIAGLDTFVALATGMIIFPACFAFGVSPDSGPGLVFITLPAVFEQMWMGQLWATLFFIFMGFAAISTVIAVFEGILSFWMDQWNFSRKKAVAINIVLIPLLSVPCALGFNVWSGFELPGIGNIQAIEDFLVSNNILVIGSLIFVLFCVSKRGWGWENFLKEANMGKGLKFPRALYYWMKIGVPVLIIVILVSGWMPLVTTWIGG
ncbi:sodium-dependent transporter [Anaerotardibacter muris]|uniref:sodium-dependent transporter n=1 Tax=Anaerotardibacter muris TaxID=2941505 RepID=UPI0020407E6C|nr:sodium-dependent transporter [Anaerotardibacter muris]